MQPIANIQQPKLSNQNTHYDDEVIISESPRVLKINGPGCLIQKPNLSCIRYMAHRLEIRNITLGILDWIPKWVLEVYLENCHIIHCPQSHINLPHSVIQLTCRNCSIDEPNIIYSQLIHHRLIRLELIEQKLQELPVCIAENAPNLLFLNLNSNEITTCGKWPKKVRGLRLSSNKLFDLSQIGKLPPYLEDLDISNNLFAEIPTAHLPQYLRKLNIARNNLHWLPDDSNEYPPNLRELIISGNCGLNDLTDAVFPDMLTTLNASECEIEKLPHDWEYSCLMNLDVSDNNIGNLDELPVAHVLNINYIGNPCWMESSVASQAISPSELNGFIDDNLMPTYDVLEEGLVGMPSTPNSVFTSSGMGSPVFENPTYLSDIANFDELESPKYISNNSRSPAIFQSLYSSSEEDIETDTGKSNTKHTDDETYMQEYKEAISRSSSGGSLQNYTTRIGNMKKSNNPSVTSIASIASNDAMPYTNVTNDPLVKAIDYVVTSGIRRVESFIFAMSDILAQSEYDNQQVLPDTKNNNTTLPTHAPDDLHQPYYSMLSGFD